MMDRYWLLTNTTYGTWLPGDRRGFIGQVLEHRDEDEEKHRVCHNIYQSEYDADIPKLYHSSQQLLKCDPIVLNHSHAQIFFQQLFETAKYRQWEMVALSIMHNHFHLVVGANSQTNPSKILGDFKSWGTRVLSAHFGAPTSKTWWTERGSKRLLPDEDAVRYASIYVTQKQPNPLLVWSSDL